MRVVGNSFQNDIAREWSARGGRVPTRRGRAFEPLREDTARFTRWAARGGALRLPEALAGAVEAMAHAASRWWRYRRPDGCGGCVTGWSAAE